MIHRFLVPLTVMAALVAVPVASARAAFDIQLADTGNASANAGFELAAQFWESQFTDDVTIYIDSGFSNLGAGILGQAGSKTVVDSYTDVRTALLADITTGDDTTATNNLQPAGELDFLTNRRSDSAVIRPSGDAYNSFLSVNRANMKALGLFGAHTGDTTALNADATITFNSTFSWDFDNTDGVGAGLQDFVGVAIHEIGHALGFTSGVDTIDAVTGAGPSAPPTDLNGANPGTPDISEFAVFNTLDLYRYTQNSLAEGSQPANGAVLGLTFGGDDVAATEPFFSIDAGATALATFATGAFNGGESDQASHWEDNLGIGIMDPSALPAGNVNTVSALDILALDVIGWDITSETPAIPTPAALPAGLMLLGFAAARRRNRAA